MGRCHIYEVSPGRTDADGNPIVSPVFRNVMGKAGLAEETEFANLGELFERTVGLHADAPCLGWRPMRPDGTAEAFTFLTYQETMDRVKSMARALTAMGVRKGDRVGLYAANCPELMMSIQVCNRLGVMVVPLYDTLGKDAVEHIIKHAETKVVFVEASKASLLGKATANCELVEHVVYWREVPEDTRKELEAVAKTSVQSMSELLQKGEAHPDAADKNASDLSDICTIMYTSGTTGPPKGVLICHHNFLACIRALRVYIKEIDVAVGRGDSVLSFMPLAHSFQRTVEETLLSLGAAIGYYQGNPRKIPDDLMALRPTIMVAVPRIFERTYQAVQANLKGFKGFLFNLAFKWKMARLKRGADPVTGGGMLDALFFNPIRNRLGGRTRFVVSGGAPLAPHIEDFMRVVMCCLVAQGYGLTESTAASLLPMPAEDPWYTVGAPLPCVEMRLSAVPEMNYYPREGSMRGELCLRGLSMFQGYYKMPEKTQEVVDEDGFFHTGDIAEILPNGCVRVIDRFKNIFKLAHGEYIAVEMVEGALKEAEVVEQIWVYGNSQENSLVAVVVPVKRRLESWAASQQLRGLSFADLCQAQQAREKVTADLKAAAKKAQLQGFEVVKAVWLESEPFSVDNDLLSPTMKLKRPQLLEKYSNQIQSMYRDLASR